MNALGSHLLVEYSDCDEDILNDVGLLEEAMKGAADRSGATIVNSVFHLFHPHGVSGVVVIAESHFAIHTWPEYRFAAADFFTCGKNVASRSAIEFLRVVLKAGFCECKEIPRGKIGPSDGALRHKPEALAMK